MTALRIESFQGSVEELVTFVNDVWQQSYRGKMTFPTWTPDYFDWQFRLADESSRSNLIAAYDGERLAGVLLGTNYPFRSPAGRHLGSQWSWLSVHPDFRGRGVTKLLDEERTRRQIEAGSKLIVGFRYFGSRYSMSEQPRAGKDNHKFNRKVGFWARVLDAPRFSQWHWNHFQGALANSTRIFHELSDAVKPPTYVRRFAPEDLEACLQLARRSFESLTLSIDWDQDSLRHQLSGGSVTHTYVLETADGVTGFMNFHVLPFSARTIEKVAVIDMFVLGAATSNQLLPFVNHCLRAMRAEGAVLALKARLGDAPWWPLVQAQFLPQKPDSYLVLQPVGGSYEVEKTCSIHVLWR